MRSARELTASQLQELRELMERNRREIEAMLVALIAKEADPQVSAGGRLDPLTRRQKPLVALRKSQLMRSLNHIRAALWRMRAGQYGVCLSCDGAIGYTRLRYKPEAPLCQLCQFLGGGWRSAPVRAQ